MDLWQRSIHPSTKAAHCPSVHHLFNSETWKTYVAGGTYGGNGTGKCKDPHRSSHNSPTISLDQGTCNHRSEKSGSGHGAVEKGEGLGIGSAGAEGTWIGSFFFFDHGGEVSSDGGNDEDEGETWKSRIWSVSRPTPIGGSVHWKADEKGGQMR